MFIYVEGKELAAEEKSREGTRRPWGGSRIG